MDYLAIIMLIIVIGIVAMLFIDSVTSKVKNCESSNCFVTIIEKLFS